MDVKLVFWMNTPDGSSRLRTAVCSLTSHSVVLAPRPAGRKLWSVSARSPHGRAANETGRASPRKVWAWGHAHGAITPPVHIGTAIPPMHMGQQPGTVRVWGLFLGFLLVFPSRRPFQKPGLQEWKQVDKIASVIGKPSNHIQHFLGLFRTTDKAETHTLKDVSICSISNICFRGVCKS